MLGQGSIVQLLRLGQLYKDDIRELRGLCLRQGAQVRLGRVELSGVVEVVAGDYIIGDALDLNKGVTVAEIADTFNRPEGIGVVRIDRVGVLLVAEDNDAVGLPANVAGVIADFHNELCGVRD